MWSEEKLLELLKKSKIDGYKLNTAFDGINTMQLVNTEDLLFFSCRHNIDTVFYNYTFINEDALNITEDVTSNLKFDEDTLSVLQAKLDDYNKSLLKLEFNKPVYLEVYCIYQGVVFFIREDDYWFVELGFGMPETVCVEFANDYFEDIIAEKKRKKQMITDSRNKLREQILNDEEFQKCTNIELRRMYADKIFNNSKYNQSLFRSEKSGLYDVPINTFIEEVWREYKDSLKK